MAEFLISYTTTAKIQLNAIFDYAAAYSYSRALDLRKAIGDKLILLTKSPFIGKAATNVSIPIENSRVTVCKPYLIFYSVDLSQNVIYIESILHEAQENLDWIFA